MPSRLDLLRRERRVKWSSSCRAFVLKPRGFAVKPDRESVTEQAEVSNVTIALASLERRGGAERYVDIEDVTIEAYRIAPERFSWRTKREFPSQERVRTAFVHANQQHQRKERGPLVVSNTDGSSWKLTAEGLDWIRRKTARADRSIKVARVASSGSVSARRIREIRRHPAFEAYRNGKPIAQIARHELAELLVCPPDAPRTAVLRKLDRARTAAVDVQDDEVTRFLEEVGREIGHICS
jgi:hypothetical protein